jgi:WD40 repeat protein
LETGKQILTQIKHNKWVRAVAITPDGKQFISGSDGGNLIVWDLKIW